MSLQSSESKQTSSGIFYKHISPAETSSDEHSPATRTSVVCLHGLNSCHLEYTRAVPYLPKDWELYLVDLPGHSQSKNVPFTLDNAINALTELITTQIIGGKAHIVGLSLGGFIALEFARKSPELVSSLFCTGCAPYSGYRQWFISRPQILGGLDIVLNRIATDAIYWSHLGVEPFPEIRREHLGNQSMALAKAGYGLCATASLQKLSEIRDVRIAITAGGKEDSVKETTEAGKVLQKSNPDCRAYVVKAAIHWWDIQLPELFAQGVKAWIEGSEMPKDFEQLS